MAQPEDFVKVNGEIINLGQLWRATRSPGPGDDDVVVWLYSSASWDSTHGTALQVAGPVAEALWDLLLGQATDLDAQVATPARGRKHH